MTPYETTQMPMSDEMLPQGIDPEEDTQEDVSEDAAEMTADKEFVSENIALNLDKPTLDKISRQCKDGFDVDLVSRMHWEKDLDTWLALAMQKRENKSYPWNKASNVKYPLLSTAAMQFAARAYPSLVPSNGKVVMGQVIGADDTGEKKEKADRVATYMSYQLMHEMTSWEEDMDKMLMMLPIVGLCFKKTYYDPSTEKICSYLLSPKNLVVNYWADSLENAERVTEIFELSPRLVKERQNQKIYRDVEFNLPVIAPNMGTPAQTDNLQSKVDETTPYVMLEQHTYLDLDNDGYAEPYIVTLEKESGIVVRIVPRFHQEQIKLDEESDKIVKIDPIQFYTKFSFVPNPDGSFYSLGFGVLLGPLNESVNTLINQLVDSGTLNNLQSGFIGKGLRLKMGETGFQPGEWKTVNMTGDDLKKSIVPLPTKDPSSTLFQLMGSLITSGKELASVAEIFTGKMPGQNTPATTTMATVEQGMKVFTAVYKRIFRSLGEEFKKIYKLNRLYLDPNTYSEVLDETIGPDDFDSEKYDICPGADPTAISQSEKLMKAQGLMELMATGVLDPVKVVMRILDAQEQPNWQELMNPQVAETGQLPPPPPDPKVQALQMKAQADAQAADQDMQIRAQDAEVKSRSEEQKLAMAAMAGKQKVQEQAIFARIKAVSQAQMNQARIEGAKGQAQQKAQQSAEQHQVKLQQMKETTKLAARNKTSSSGKRTK